MQPRPAIVSIMADGSVMVTTAGMEMGQGMFTKVKQVSSAAAVTTGLTPGRRCMQGFQLSSALMRAEPSSASFAGLQRLWAHMHRPHGMESSIGRRRQGRRAYWAGWKVSQPCSWPLQQNHPDVTTHVTQVAVHELSKALPEDQRPLPLDKVQVNDNASFWLPNSGGTAGSTAAEGSCEAVRMACEQLVSKPVLHIYITTA